MPWFEGTHTETRTLSATPEQVIAHLQDPTAVVAATKGVESADIDGHTIHFVLEEEDHQVVKFKADYVCTYEPLPNGVRWTTSKGNLEQRGEATVEADSSGDAGSVLRYTETLRIDLGVPSMMAPMLQPMVGPMLAGEVKAFVERYVAPLQR